MKTEPRELNHENMEFDDKQEFRGQVNSDGTVEFYVWAPEEGKPEWRLVGVLEFPNNETLEAFTVRMGFESHDDPNDNPDFDPDLRK